MVSLASANRDPARFANPDVFDITSADANRHVAFGKLIDVCLGTPLAVAPEEVSWGGSFLSGFVRLPVLF